MLLAGYVDENAADSILEALKEDMDAGLIQYDDAAVVRRGTDGEVHINETGDMTTGKGAGIGALIGGVIGILGGPAGIAIGAAAGAGIGGIAAHSDAGFNNETLERIGGALPAGSSALAVTTSEDFIESVRDQASDDDTMNMAQQIADGITGALNAGEDVLMALVLTDDAVAATKVVAGPDSLSVFNVAAVAGDDSSGSGGGDSGSGSGGGDSGSGSGDSSS
jgi:uncharacterized membrane protein